jgi:ribosomal protein S13
MKFKKYGLGLSSLNYFKSYEGFNKKYSLKLTINRQNNILSKSNLTKLTDKKLYDNVRENINFHKSIKSYRGTRHKNQYPVRGQRTHTNAKKKIFKSKNFL